MRLIDGDELLKKVQQEKIQAQVHGREFSTCFMNPGGTPSTEWWFVEDLIENAPTIASEPCEDAVSRQAAIDAVSNGCQEWRGIFGRCEENILALPTAQPENIKCYECKHGIHSGCGDVYICNVSPELVMEHTGDFYCGYAKRKTDEEAN